MGSPHALADRPKSFRFNVFVVKDYFGLSYPAIRRSMRVRKFRRVGLRRPYNPLLFQYIRRHRQRQILHLFLVIRLARRGVPMIHRSQTNNVSIMFLYQFFTFRRQSRILNYSQRLLTSYDKYFTNQSSNCIS